MGEYKVFMTPSFPIYLQPDVFIDQQWFSGAEAWALTAFFMA